MERPSFFCAVMLAMAALFSTAFAAIQDPFPSVTPLTSPIPESLYSVLAITLISAGLAATGAFFVYEVTVSRFRRSWINEAFIGGAASILLGFGTLFLFLWTGVYV